MTPLAAIDFAAQRSEELRREATAFRRRPIIRHERTEATGEHRRQEGAQRAA